MSLNKNKKGKELSRRRRKQPIEPSVLKNRDKKKQKKPQIELNVLRDRN